MAALRRVDPELAPSLYPGRTTGPKKSGASNPSEAKVEAVLEWLREHRDEVNANGGIHSSGMVARDDYDVIPTQSGTSKALAILRERKLVRLDHTGTGGSKYFKVV